MRNFKFFHGYVSTLTTVWMPDTDGRDYYGLNVEQELTRQMSNQIAEEIDNQIIRELTRTINDGGNSIDGDYLNRWINMGGQRA